MRQKINWKAFADMEHRAMQGEYDVDRFGGNFNMCRLKSDIMQLRKKYLK